MAWPLALIAAGTALQVYGNYRANMDQADAEAKNANFYREQAHNFELATQRELKIHQRESNMLFGRQVGAYASAGVKLSSGSALDVLMYSRKSAIEEDYAIQREGDSRVRLAMLRAEQADQTAASLRDPMNNAMQAAGPILSAAGNYTGNGTSSKAKTGG